MNNSLLQPAPSTSKGPVLTLPSPKVKVNFLLLLLLVTRPARPILDVGNAVCSDLQGNGHGQVRTQQSLPQNLYVYDRKVALDKPWVWGNG